MSQFDVDKELKRLRDIVVDLAASDPVTASSDHCDECVLCEAWTASSDHIVHLVTCPWLRARVETGK